MIGQDYLPDIVVWDSSLSVSSGRTPPQNNGCPEGYFAQFVGLGEPGSTPVPGKTYALRCRLMETSTAETIKEESGITFQEAVDVYTEAVQDTVRQVGGALSFGLPWVALGLIALATMYILPRGRS